MNHRPMKRYIDEQLVHFIAFIQPPHITTDIPVGERKLEPNGGEKITVPDVIDNMTHLRTVAQYLVYCGDTTDGDGFKPLAPSSVLTILQKCILSTRHSLAGLDETSSDGATAFDQLRTMCDKIGTDGQRRASLFAFLRRRSICHFASSQA
jgi:hypothetical protein